MVYENTFSSCAREKDVKDLLGDFSRLQRLAKLLERCRAKVICGELRRVRCVFFILVLERYKNS